MSGRRRLALPWLIMGFRILAIPAWLLAAGFGGWDAYALFSGAGRGSGIKLGRECLLTIFNDNK